MCGKGDYDESDIREFKSLFKKDESIQSCDGVAVEALPALWNEKMQEQLGNVDDILREGRIAEITQWLGEQIHQYGNTRTLREVIAAVCIIISKEGKGITMAKLYYYYGAMNSSKTANALMTQFNYEEVGQKALLCKTEADTRDGVRKIRSRIGLEMECILLNELQLMTEEQIRAYDCIIVDEVQFATKEQIDFLSDIVDFFEVPVVCYGLRADFQNNLFTGSQRLIAIADSIHEIKTVCWCGKKATCNARYNENGIVRDGEQVMLGANDSYVALCRKHFKLGMLGPHTGEVR